MNYVAFYDALFAPVVAGYSPLDPGTRFHLVGFDAGGPVNYCVAGSGPTEGFVTCVTCELAPRAEQVPTKVGTYELLISGEEENWCASLLTRIAQMSLEVGFDHGHTLDIGPWVGEDCPVQAIAFEQFAAMTFEGHGYAILRCHGLFRPELTFARAHGVEALLTRLRQAGVYPHTSLRRTPVITDAQPGAQINLFWG